MTDVTLYPDRSQWNGVIPAEDFGPVEALRVDTGFETDPIFQQNWANAQAAHAAGKLQILILYVVHITGNEQAIATRVKAALGGTCPVWVAFMVDEESGAGFDGPGNHSAGANLMVQLLAAFSGRGIAAVCGYANSPDWQSNWASRVTGLKRIVANYSSTPPAGYPTGVYGWQYWGGVKNPAPAGYPTPAGLDMNVIPRTVAQIVADFGGEDVALDPNDPVVKEILAAIAGLRADVDAVPENLRQHEYNVDISSNAIVASERAQVATLLAQAAQILANQKPPAS